MANWSPLRERLEGVGHQVTFQWEELDSLVGGLPPSAYKHAAFWKGDRSGWPGFTTTSVVVGRQVTFVRQNLVEDSAARRQEVGDRGTAVTERLTPDVVLVGCVKQKLAQAAPAEQLYTSALFRRERDYAVGTGVPWFILSALYGLVAPDDVIAPYELRLSDTRQRYRREWAIRVATKLEAAMGSLAGLAVEVHAGSVYVDPLRPLLAAGGATVVDPLKGLTMGRRLQWYGSLTAAKTDAPTRSGSPAGDADSVVAALVDQSTARTPAQLGATSGRGLDSPGLYSWWVDVEGAADLSGGLELPVEPGLIYAGLAGATRARSGRRSSNTLWGRLNGMHLGGRHEFSTFRRTLGSILAQSAGAESIDEAALTAWMYGHLRVIAFPVQDADTLDSLETAVLNQLDPPLNLAKMAPTPIRRRTSDLRRRHARR